MDRTNAGAPAPADDDDFDGADPSELLISRYGDRGGNADDAQRFDEEEASWLAEASMFTPAECPEPPPRTERFTSPTVRHRFSHDEQRPAASSRRYNLADEHADDNVKNKHGDSHSDAPGLDRHSQLPPPPAGAPALRACAAAGRSMPP